MWEKMGPTRGKQMAKAPRSERGSCEEALTLAPEAGGWEKVAAGGVGRSR